MRLGRLPKGSYQVTIMDVCRVPFEAGNVEFEKVVKATSPLNALEKVRKSNPDLYPFSHNPTTSSLVKEWAHGSTKTSIVAAVDGDYYILVSPSTGLTASMEKRIQECEEGISSR